MSKKKKPYIPKRKFNPARQAERLDRLNDMIDRHNSILETLAKSHDNHIYYLGNFARHDMKNAIQSMDSILSTNSPAEFDLDKIKALSGYLDVVRNTMEDFAKLIPYSTNGKFKAESLVIAVELLSRAEMAQRKINIKFNFERETVHEIVLPFHSLFQMMNNLIINSTKSLENSDIKKIIIDVLIENDTTLTIRIKDTGVLIEESYKDKVFEYGYSTTGGSGIGLYHAKYLAEKFKGNIYLELFTEEEFNKQFTIKIPIKDGEEYNNN